MYEGQAYLVVLPLQESFILIMKLLSLGSETPFFLGHVVLRLENLLIPWLLLQLAPHWILQRGASRVRLYSKGSMTSSSC